MKKGSKFEFTLKVVLRPCCGKSTCTTKSINFMNRERALQEFFYYKNVCDDCVCSVLFCNPDNAVIQFFGVYSFADNVIRR